jgi:uncharacterized protein YecE (DUF72 family)
MPWGYRIAAVGLVLEKSEYRSMTIYVPVQSGSCVYQTEARSRSLTYGFKEGKGKLGMVPIKVVRYDYPYQELEVWVDRIKRIVVQADCILAYFNNHTRGQVVQNAQTLEAFLKSRGAGWITALIFTSMIEKYIKTS